MPITATAVARGRWRAAEDRLYPALLADPTAYQRTLAAVQNVIGELRRRADDVDGLLAAEADSEDVLATACPSGVPGPPDLILAVACGMLDRELTAAQAARSREEAVRAAREAGSPWAVLDGPADATELTDGRRTVLHIASGTVVEAAVDPWAREEPYSLAVVPDGEARAFADREAWLAELARLEAATGD